MGVDKLVLHGFAECPSVRSVLLTISALKLQVKLNPINTLKGEHKTKEYLKMTPQHTIPTLQDNGFILSDSHAISAYLVNKYGPPDCPLYPQDYQKRALVDQRMYFNCSILFPRLRKLMEPIMYYGATSMDLAAVANLHEALQFVETFLNNTPWISGEHVALADFCCVSTINTCQICVSVSEYRYPKILAWIQRCKALPFYNEISDPAVNSFEQKYLNTVTNLPKSF